MLRKVMPAGLAAIALMAAPLPALAHGDHGAKPAAQDECCKADNDKDKDKAKDDCCAEEGKGGDKSPMKSGDACEDCDDMGHGDKGMHGDGMMGMHGGMMGHHAMMMAKGFSINHELRYMPMMGTATNQWLVLAHGPSKRVNDWFSMGWQNNLALQTFNNGPAGFWVAPYMGILPKLGYTVGQARVDVGALVGFGGMARTANVGGTADVLQARLLWAIEPRVELTWVGDEWSWGLVGTYLNTQYQADLGGFSFGVKAAWGPHGHGGMGGGMGHSHGDHH